MIDSFIETGLWSTSDYNDGESDNPEMLDRNYCLAEVSDAFKKEASVFIDKFMELTEGLFTDTEIERDHLAHDLWLTVEGHGAGFWDGDYEEGDKITEIVKGLQSYESYWGEKLNEAIERGE